MSGNGGVSVPRETVRVLSTICCVVPGMHGLPSVKPVVLVVNVFPSEDLASPFGELGIHCSFESIEGADIHRRVYNEILIGAVVLTCCAVGSCEVGVPIATDGISVVGVPFADTS